MMAYAYERKIDCRLPSSTVSSTNAHPPTDSIISPFEFWNRCSPKRSAPFERRDRERVRIRRRLHVHNSVRTSVGWIGTSSPRLDAAALEPGPQGKPSPSTTN